MGSILDRVMVVTRPVTAADVLVIAGTVLFLILMGFVGLFGAHKYQRMTLRMYEQSNPKLREWIFLPRDVIMPAAFVWNIRLGGLLSLITGIGLLVLILILSR